MPSPFYLTDGAVDFIERMRPVGGDLVVSLQEVRVVPSDSELSAAILRDSDDATLAEMARTHDDQLGESRLLPGFFDREEIEGLPTLRISGIEFCMPREMYDYFSGWCLDTDGQCLVLRKLES